MLYQYVLRHLVMKDIINAEPIKIFHLLDLYVLFDLSLQSYIVGDWWVLESNDNGIELVMHDELIVLVQHTMIIVVMAY